MARLYLFVEGQTEEAFAGRMLSPHLATFGVYLERIILISSARKKKIVHRGGGGAYLPMRDDIQRKMKEVNGNDVRFTTLIDLYAIPNEFPGLEGAEKLRQSPDKRVAALEKAFEDDIGDWRFIPYIQLHEYEALLFSDPAKFRALYTQHEDAITKIEAIAAKYDTPEMINDGPETAPSKRIIAAFPGYQREKVRVGPLIAEAIGIEMVRAKCPHFHAWLSRLEQLGGAVVP